MRLLDVKPRFVRELSKYAPRGSDEHTGIIRILRELGDERLILPGLADHSLDLPPYMMARTVPSSSLVVA